MRVEVGGLRPTYSRHGVVFSAVGRRSQGGIDFSPKNWPIVSNSLSYLTLKKIKGRLIFSQLWYGPS